MRTSLYSAAAMITLAAAAQAQFVAPTYTNNGTGCTAGDNTIYELFPTGVFDLNGQSLQYFQNGLGSYTVVVGTDTIIPPSGAETTFNGDDTPITAVPLSFTFDYPGGSTMEVQIAPNGHVNFQPDPDTRCCNGNTAIADGLEDAPAIMGFSNDLNTSTTSATGAGRIWYEEQTSMAGNSVLLCTWEDAGEFGVTPPGAAHNFQVQIHDDPSGDFVIVAYGSTTVTTDTTAVGWSSGGGQPDLGSVDFTALGAVDGGDGAISFPLTLDSSDVPAIGTTVNWDVDNVSATAALGILGLGNPVFGPMGAPLDLLGFVGCTLYNDLGITQLPLALTPPTATASLMLPNDTGIAGVPFSSQALVVDGLDVKTSNGGDLVIGNDPATFDPSLVDGIVVQFEGTNTFITTPRATPFFNLFNNSLNASEVITGFQIDFLAAGAGSEFDVDGLSTATGEFDAGNSTDDTVTPCTVGNTYVGTAVLNFAGTEAPSCGDLVMFPNLGTGWVATSDADTDGDPDIVDFTFASFGVGDSFGFEADIDGGPLGADGLNAAFVTVTTNVATYGPMQLNLIDNNTAFVAF